MNNHPLFAAVLAALVAAAPLPAAAVDDPALLAALTCGAGDAAALEAKGRKTGDGTLAFPDQVRDGGLCIENATVSAGFGVMMTAASLCDGRAEPLLAYLSRANPQLRPASAPSRPGVIGVYEAGKTSFIIFHGQPDIRRGPDPSSGTVSYICSVQGSGPQ